MWGNHQGNLKDLIKLHQGNLDEQYKITISNYGSKLRKIENGSHEACNDSKPYYLASSWPYIDKDFDCHLNGRSHDGYVK